MIPEPLSRLVMKLLAKTAEERYQSALGLRADLEHCARQWTSLGEIAAFPLGRQDVSDRFVVPQHLYGREQQLETLLHAFEQAAYAQIADGHKPPVHLRVGRLLLAQWDHAGAPEQVFDMVRHLNFASALITDDAERLTLARLNLTAGQRAKASTAYQVALSYFRAGSGLLTEAHWDVDYALLFALHREAAECEYLGGHFGQAEDAFDWLLGRARTRLDKAKIYSLKVLQYEHMSRYTEAIRTGREGMALFGLAFPDLPEDRQAALDTELTAIRTLPGGKKHRRIDRAAHHFELAHGGTIFLDEIGELPLETQVKLLRVLQEQEFEPVGSSRTVHVDVRVIAATNRDLEEAVRAGRFRSDLFYRLNVFPIQVPLLRERRSDILLLVMFFLSRFRQEAGKKVEAVPQGIMDLLTAYDWPGNIRELQNLIERAVLLSQVQSLGWIAPCCRRSPWTPSRRSLSLWVMPLARLAETVGADSIDELGAWRGSDPRRGRKAPYSSAATGTRGHRRAERRRQNPQPAS